MAHCQEFYDAVAQSALVEVPAAHATLEARLLAAMNCDMEHEMMSVAPEAQSGSGQNRRMEIRHSELRHSMEVIKEHTARIARIAKGTK